MMAQPSQKKPFFKIKDPGPASIGTPFKQLHFKIKDRYPILRARMSQKTL